MTRVSALPVESSAAAASDESNLPSSKPPEAPNSENPSKAFHSHLTDEKKPNARQSESPHGSRTKASPVAPDEILLSRVPIQKRKKGDLDEVVTGGVDVSSFAQSPVVFPVAPLQACAPESSFSTDASADLPPVPPNRAIGAAADLSAGRLSGAVPPSTPSNKPDQGVPFTSTAVSAPQPPGWVTTERQIPAMRASSDPARISSPNQAQSAGLEALPNDVAGSSPAKAAAPPAVLTAGTDAAKHHPGMLDAQPEKTSLPKTAEATLLSARAATPIARVTEPTAARNGGPGDRQPDLPTSGDAETKNPAAQITPGAVLPPSQPVPSAGPSHPQIPRVTPVFNAITDTVERLQTDGHTNVEMQLKLADGQQLTVRLQLHAGEVRATFRTDSHDWRDAITRGWSDFSSSAADRGLRITNPVFEAPNPQPGFNQFEQQSRHRQQPHDSSTESDQSFRSPSPEKSPGSRSTPPAPSAAPLLRSAKRTNGLAAWA
jgi:hypothetical protein